MKTLLATLAAIGIAAPAAAACGFHQTAGQDQMTTASIQAPLSTGNDAAKGDSTEMTGEAIAEEIRNEPAAE